MSSDSAGFENQEKDILNQYLEPFVKEEEVMIIKSKWRMSIDDVPNDYND